MNRATHLFVGVALLSACSGGQRIPTAPTDDVESVATHADPDCARVARSGCAASQSAAATTAESRDMDRGRDWRLREELETIRRVTAPFHDFDVAKQAGWSTEITACLVNPDGPGAMGFHYGKTALINGTAHVDKPQLLLYEPERDGRMRLVAVEYIIPYTDHSRDAAPPELLGQKFLRFDTFQVWGLHVWIWKDNPGGLFAPWNTRVSCRYTDDVTAMRH
jgi:hypothetical protein